ncbi:MAG TPA: hypothetical protein VF653_01315 [Methylomirabilota bacterium]
MSDISLTVGDLTPISVGDADPADTAVDPLIEEVEYETTLDPGRPTDALYIKGSTTLETWNSTHIRTSGRSLVITDKGQTHRGWKATNCLFEALPLQVPYGNKQPGDMAVLWGWRTYGLLEAEWENCISKGALVEHHHYHQGASQLLWRNCRFEGAMSQAIQIFRSNPAYTAPPPPPEFADKWQRVIDCQVIECGREGSGSRAAFALTFGNDVHGVRVHDTLVQSLYNAPWLYGGKTYYSKGAFLAESRPAAELARVVVNYKQPDRTLVYCNRVKDVSIDACRIYGGTITIRDCTNVEIKRCRGDGNIVVQKTNSQGNPVILDVVPIRAGYRSS